MKIIISMLVACLFTVPGFAQGLQDGGQGSGGDEQAEYSIAVIAQWNMVSVPISANDYLKTSLFPSASSVAYLYSGGTFVVKDTLENGPGYWLKFPAPQSISLSGSIVATDSIPVNQGWNMIGSISDPLPTSSVTSVGTSIQTRFFSFNNGYLVANSIDPGVGYWVKTSSSGTLVLSTGSAPAKRGMEDSLTIILANLNSLVIADASGGNQTLYFGHADEQMRGYAELPPVPPAGIFDARFASQSMIASGNENILLASATFPVEVRWTVATQGSYALVVDGKETPLNTNGSILLTNPVSRISLKIESAPELPAEFGLSQNYPNPFNPTTNIKFALPVHSQVRVELYSILGQRVATVVNEALAAGYHTASWNGLGDQGRILGSGVYFYRILAVPTSGGAAFTDVKKMMFVK